MNEGGGRVEPDVTALVLHDREDKARRVTCDSRNRYKPTSFQISGAPAIRDPDPAGGILKHGVTSFGKSTRNDLLRTGPCGPVLCAVYRQLSIVPTIQPLERPNQDAVILRGQNSRHHIV